MQSPMPGTFITGDAPLCQEQIRLYGANRRQGRTCNPCAPASPRAGSARWPSTITWTQRIALDASLFLIAHLPLLPISPIACATQVATATRVDATENQLTLDRALAECTMHGTLACSPHPRRNDGDAGA